MHHRKKEVEKWVQHLRRDGTRTRKGLFLRGGGALGLAGLGLVVLGLAGGRLAGGRLALAGGVSTLVLGNTGRGGSGGLDKGAGHGSTEVGAALVSQATNVLLDGLTGAV